MGGSGPVTIGPGDRRPAEEPRFGVAAQGKTNLVESSIRLVCDVRSVPEARHFVTDAVHRWNGPGDLSDTELLTTEVVTNAVVHGRTDVDLAVRYDPTTELITVEVRDHGPEHIHRPEHDQHSTSGRGLRIVDQVADSWGVNEVPGEGKVVWFALRAN